MFESMLRVVARKDEKNALNPWKWLLLDADQLVMQGHGRSIVAARQEGAKAKAEYIKKLSQVGMDKRHSLPKRNFVIGSKARRSRLSYS